MIVYLGSNSLLRRFQNVNLLFNFYKDPPLSLKERKGRIICDSGAFSFMMDPKKISKIDIDQYCDEYCDSIKNYDIQNFFELDVDTLMGVEKVRELRRRIELRTGRRPIPVWHNERGKEGWIEMCSEYDYVALPLSGKNNTSKWLARDGYKNLWWFVNEAHKRGARIHALGLGVNKKVYKKGAFYSCDSVSYTFAARSRYIYIFSKEGEWKREAYRSGKRLNVNVSIEKTVEQWEAFSRWAEFNL